METKSNYQEDIFREMILQMDDRDLLLAYTNKADYTPSFIQLAEAELSIRGYDTSQVSTANIDYLVIQKKETEELVKIYTNGTDYIKGWAELAKSELERRKFDLDTLYQTKSDNSRFLKEGVPGRYIVLGYIFSFLGGLVGLLFAFNYMSSKQTAVNGEKYYKYNRSTQNNGKAMLILSVLSIVVQLIIRLS